jgi:hypothetical protein
MDKAVRRRLRDSRFRPRIVEGEIVESTAVVTMRFQHTQK